MYQVSPQVLTGEADVLTSSLVDLTTADIRQQLGVGRAL